MPGMGRPRPAGPAGAARTHFDFAIGSAESECSLTSEFTSGPSAVVSCPSE
jgi:hypothetical protein